MKRLTSARAFLNFALLALLGTSTSSAHPAVDFYGPPTGGGTWGFNANVDYYYFENVPSNWRPIVNNGFEKWSDRASGLSPRFDPSGEIDFNNHNSCAPFNIIARENNAFMDDALGATDLCIAQSTVFGFDMYFNSNLEAADPPSTGWYVGTGTPGPNQWDLFSIAAHEAGHATGWSGHFARNGGLCEANSSAQTMCTGANSYNTRRGTKYLRTLEDHDIHTNDNAY